MARALRLRALPGKKHTLVDFSAAVGSGFGGDPNSFAKLDFSKGKIYEFSGLFRRDRQYFDYDLLGNPNIPAGQSIPSVRAPTGSLAWPQVLQSPVMFNTVRRMTDTSLTLFPLVKGDAAGELLAEHLPRAEPEPRRSSNYFAESIGANDALLRSFSATAPTTSPGAIDWKPVAGTKLTFEEQVAHYKADSYFTLAASSSSCRRRTEAVAPGDWDSTDAL